MDELRVDELRGAVDFVSRMRATRLKREGTESAASETVAILQA